MGFVPARVALEDVSGGPIRREGELLVDTGALYSMVPAAVLRSLGIEPRQSLPFELADGGTIERAVGEARFYFDGRNAVSPVIFGDKGDAGVLGVVTLEALALEVDPVRKQIRPTRLLLYECSSISA